MLVTASDDHKVIQHYLDFDAVFYISKSFDFNSILQAILDMLAK